MTFRYALGYLHVARFLFGGPLAALPPDPEPEPPGPSLAARMRFVVFVVTFTAGLAILLFAALEPIFR